MYWYCLNLIKSVLTYLAPNIVDLQKLNNLSLVMKSSDSRVSSASFITIL
ncbi:hypothetical protein PBCV1_a075aR [Paramecium bursaria Chlorella virus 1]|uniref:Uncharacterized protein n=1 Tax=Paramecium bursaria Chlorella virus 1 TaxID=10506 RepID=F8TTW6_PBCV1|nr:hypothetical protein PBCV1_a075aR [Paramecium bursaria Chlorella virus 1]AEI70027.1 hypothetical protein [Paramecium bursaria Chlorella virus 1]